jgi:hypothetical protein
VCAGQQKGQSKQSAAAAASSSSSAAAARQRDGSRQAKEEASRRDGRARRDGRSRWWDGGQGRRPSAGAVSCAERGHDGHRRGAEPGHRRRQPERAGRVGWVGAPRGGSQARRKASAVGIHVSARERLREWRCGESRGEGRGAVLWTHGARSQSGLAGVSVEGNVNTRTRDAHDAAPTCARGVCRPGYKSASPARGRAVGLRCVLALRAPLLHRVPPPRPGAGSLL